jgi:hypothetical protein
MGYIIRATTIQSKFVSTSFICSILKGEIYNPVTSSLLKVPNCVRSTFERREAKTEKKKLQSGKCMFLPALIVQLLRALLIFLLFYPFFSSRSLKC